MASSHVPARPWIALPLLLACTLACAGAAFAWPGREPAPETVAASNCTNLSAIPLNTNVNFATQVQPVFDNWCISCHNNGDMSGQLSLEAGTSLDLLVEVTAFGGNGNYTRVVPGYPRLSALFVKVNCDNVDFGSPMPLGGTLPLQDQAMLYDWIYEGAKPSDLSDWLFRNSFDSERI